MDALVAGVGTGGTITGAGEGLKERNPELLVVAVEPAASPCSPAGRRGRTRSRASAPGFVPPVLNRDVVDEIIPVDDEDAIETARAAPRTEGVLRGISCGAALWAAIACGLRPEMRGKRIVVICPTPASATYHPLLRAPDDARPRHIHAGRARVAADLTAAQERDPAARGMGRLEILLTYGGVQALLAHRVAHALHEAGVPLAPRLLANATRVLPAWRSTPPRRSATGPSSITAPAW